MRIVLPAMMLAVFITGIAISDFHSHRDCRDSENCAMCTFQSFGAALSPDASQGIDPRDLPVLHILMALPERVSEPFHISVFPSHAPPRFS
jgi:hypothetical protein